MPGSTLLLKVLPYRMVLASIKKEHLPTCTHAILKLILFQDRNNRGNITCIGRRCKQVLQYTNQVWRIIQVDEGPLGFESVGIVDSICAPLAENNISIYHLSTYDTDHTLVESDNLEKAVAALKSADFVFTNEEHSPPSPPPVKNRPKRRASVNYGQAQMVISKLPFELYLTKLPEDWRETLVKPLLQLLFFADTPRLLSVTITSSEASLILDRPSIALFPPQSLEECQDVWRALQICEGAYGFNECGILSKFAAPLAEAQISIFNLSTYVTDYALVAEKNFDKTILKLQENFDIITDNM